MRLRWLARTLALSCLAGVASHSVRADILMLDLHVSNDEVAAARRAAEARGENLVVVPLISQAIREELGRLAYHAQRIHYRDVQAERQYKAAEAAVPPNTQELERLKDLRKQYKAETSEVEKQRSAIEKKLPPLDSEMIRRAIHRIEVSHQTVTSLIISGHSNGLEFWGDEWDINRQQIKGILDEFPDSTQSLRSVYLWGCYSAERGDVDWWKTSYPSLQVMIGFSDVAPGAGSGASPHLLQDALTREAEMANVKDFAEAAEAFHSLRDVNETTAAAALNACYLGTHFAPVRLDSVADCGGAAHGLKSGFALYSACFAATPRCPDPPDNVHNSSLRKFYTDYLEVAHCAATSPYIRDLPARDRVLALIFFANVRGNFALYYKTQIEAANAYLAKHGAPKLPNFDGKKETRQEILARLKQLRELGAPISKNAALQELLDHAGTLVKDLSCVPTTWITEEPESGHRLAAPSC